MPHQPFQKNHATSLSFRRFLCYCLTIAVGYATPAHADFWSDLGNVITAPQRIPLEMGRNLIQRDDPLEPIRGAGAAGGRILQQGSNEVQRAHDLFMSVPGEAIQDNFGTDWARAYDYLTASQRVNFEMATTSGRFLGGCLRGQRCGLQQLTAAPLAAAMRDAYKVYIGYSQPLHPVILRILSRVVPRNVLVACRITVGRTPDFTVPGMLNSGHELFHRGHAVTLGNLMIFSRDLNFSDLHDWNWLLHELFHIEQYQRYSRSIMESIDGFAIDYVGHYNSIENEAQNAADNRQGNLNQLCQGGC